MKSAAKLSKRQLRERSNKRKRTTWIALLSFFGVAIVAGIIYATVATSSFKGLMGDEVAVASSEHVALGTDPGPYASNPPAGGKHYAEEAEAGFFNESDIANLGTYPEGYLVHNLEHGYVIFWYNCASQTDDCVSLKSAIEKVMQQEGNTKLIAFPWPGMGVPLAMTSWGRILKFSTIDQAAMREFIQRNRYQAPEPDAP